MNQRTAERSERAHDTVARSFVALGLGEALARIVAFCGMLLVARRLGADGLGVISFSAALLLYLSRVVDAGFDMGIGIREAALRRERLGDFIGAVLAFRLLLAVGVIVITVAIALAVLPDREGRVTALYCLTLIPTALSARWALTGLDRTVAAGLARTAGELSVLTAIALLVHESTDITRVPLAQLLGDSVAVVIVVVGLRQLAVRVRIRWDGEELRPLLVRHIVPFVGSGLLGIVLFNADIILLRLFRDATTVGLYAAAYALLSFLINIGTTYALSLMPSLTNLANDPETRQRVFADATAKVFLVVLPITVGGGLTGAGILRVVYGAEFIPATTVFALLLLSAPFSMLRSVSTAALMAERREGALLRMSGIAAAVNVLLNLIVVPRWGMIGAAAATVATEVLRLVLAQHMATTLGFALPQLLRTWKPLLAGLLMALILLTPIRANPWIAIPIAAAVYGAALMALGALKIRRGALPELRV